MKYATSIIFLAILLAGVPQQDWKNLYNGRNLDGWDTWLGSPLDDRGRKMSDTPIGLNHDPNRVFSIAKIDGENVIRISGNGWGGISTRNEYSNYHLQLMFKWGDSTWGPKKGKKKDSGLLYHAVGPHGADYGAWMRSQEFQVQEGDCGDFWGVAGGLADVPAERKSDSVYVYDPNGRMYTFSEHRPVGRHCIKNPDAEKPTGQWNTIDLYCSGDTSIHVVNGKVVMILYHSRQLNNGVEQPLIKGKIQIQSEGAEVYFKNIRIRPIGQIPGNLLTAK